MIEDKLFPFTDRFMQMIFAELKRKTGIDNSMLKFSVLDMFSSGGVAVSSNPALDSAIAPSLIAESSGQLPYPHWTMSPNVPSV